MTLNRLSLLLLLVSVSVAGCAAGASSVEAGSASEAAPEAAASSEQDVADESAEATGAKNSIEEHRIYTSKIENYDQFMHYSDMVSGERYTKLIVDLRTDQVFFFDVNIYPLHSDFVFAEIYKKEQTAEALADYMVNYEEEKTEFLLVYLVHHVAQDIWAFAFWEGDEGRAEYVVKAYDRLQDTFFSGDKLKFRPDSYHQEQVAEQLGRVPVVTNEEIYSQKTLQVFNKGSRVGKLRIVTDLTDEQVHALTYDPDQILLLNEAIPDLTVVSGVISEEFSTPLSHVALRARAWGIPHIGLKNASTQFKPLEGEMVFFEATADNYMLRKATADELAQWEAKKNEVREVQIPALDLESRKLAPLEELRMTNVAGYGAKTANLGELVHAQVEGCNVPAGFGIPIHYYDQHMEANGLKDRVTKLLGSEKFRGKSPEERQYRKDELAKLQVSIREGKIDEKLLDEVHAKAEEIGKLGSGRGVFVRSSTNAEDLPGFSGAGLYDSVPFVQGRDKLGEAVKKVWASVWNLRAYEEREHYGIDHASVYGAVLVQTAMPATGAGVLITANIYDRRDETTHTINAKHGVGIRVVEGHKVPEQILYNYHRRSLKILSRSDDDVMLVPDENGGVKEITVAKGEPVLTHRRTAKLVQMARKMVEVYPKEHPLDIEWLFVDEELHIVQSRPYMSE